MRPSGLVVLVVTVLGMASCASSAPATRSAVTWGSCDAVTSVYGANTPPERVARLEFQCGTLQVPLDPDRAAGEKLTLQLIKAHLGGTGSTNPTKVPDEAETLDSLLLIPGGPGQSGVDNHAFLVGQLSDRLLGRFDVVGFDPRGVGHSGLLHCEHTKTPPRLPDLTTDAGYARTAAEARAGTQECLTTLGDRASFFGTTAAAGDVDAIRAALGESTLTFVGGSYGAKLGAEYVRRYPTHVRAGVLDAPTDPRTDWVTTAEHQVQGFEDSIEEFVDWCTRQRCPDLPDVRGSIAALVAEADRSPIPSGRPGGDDPLAGSQVLDAVVSAMYDDVRWPDLAAGLVEARDGDSGTLWDLVEAQTGGSEATDTSDANFVINCTDSAPGPSEAQIRAAGARFRSRFPTLGVWGSWQLFGCSFWTAQRHTLAPPVARDAPPLVVVGTVGDPATPYAGAGSMAGTLGNGSTLLTWEGSGHTAFTRSPCVDAAVDEYLLSLTLPSKGTRCPA